MAGNEFNEATYYHVMAIPLHIPLPARASIIRSRQGPNLIYIPT